MSLRAFQTALVRLATEPGFRASLESGDEGALSTFELTPRERARLIDAASDPGLAVTATLISSFRLGKILSLLPLTRTLLGNRRLGREVRQFWDRQPPRSFYALEEVLAFCDYLNSRLATGLRVPYLRDVLALEHTMLELQRPEVGAGRRERGVRLQYDPTQLLPPLTNGQRPRRVRRRPCALLVVVEEDGALRWLSAGS